MEWNRWTTLFACLFFARTGFELFLDMLQRRHLERRGDRVPAHLEGLVPVETVRRAVTYNRDKLSLSAFLHLHGSIATWAMILVGFGWIDGAVAHLHLSRLPSGLAFFGLLGFAGFVWNLPVALYSTFGIEARHGFNRQTFQGFVQDKLKEIVIGLALGGAFASLLLLLMDRGGASWWLYAFIGAAGFQILVAWLYPVAIMPLFNRFTPVAPELADAVAGLAKRVAFPLRGVVAMDGSRRSAHSNAFLVGLRGARRIVLYDTLIERIGQPELLAVLAHELGHFKLRHLRRRLVLGIGALFILLLALAFLREQRAVYAGLGFARISDHAALVVFALVMSEIAAPFGWLMRFFSRREELAADRFAVEACGTGRDLDRALVELGAQNLSTPGSHRLYRAYHNTHPPLRQRLEAIRDHAQAKGLS